MFGDGRVWRYAYCEIDLYSVILQPFDYLFVLEYYGETPPSELDNIRDGDILRRRRVSNRCYHAAHPFFDSSLAHSRNFLVKGIDVAVSLRAMISQVYR